METLLAFISAWFGNLLATNLARLFHSINTARQQRRANRRMAFNAIYTKLSSKMTNFVVYAIYLPACHMLLNSRLAVDSFILTFISINVFVLS